MIPQNSNAYYTLDAATLREFREVAKLLQRFRSIAQKRRLPALRMRLIRYIPKTYYRRLRTAFSFCLNRCFAEDRALVIPKQLLRADHTWYTRNALKNGDWSYLRKLHRSVTNRQRKDRLAVAWTGFAMGFLGLGVQETSCFIDTLTKSILETALAYGLPCDCFAVNCLLYHMIVTGLCTGDEFPGLDDRSDRLIAGQLPSGEAPFPQFPDRVFREKAEHSLIQYLIWLKFLQCIPVLGCIGGIVNWFFHQRILGYVNISCRRACLRQLLEHQTKITAEPEWTILSVEIKPEGEAES